MKIFEICSILFSLANAEANQVVNKNTSENTEPAYRIVEMHSMETPVSKKEFEYFQTMGSAVMTKNRVILTPELQDRRGQMFSKYYVQSEHAWSIMIQVNIGNEMKTESADSGFGIHYLKSIKKSSLGDSQFGYANKFDGLGVYLNSVLKALSDDGTQENYIQAYFNDNTKQVDLLNNNFEGLHSCKAKFRNLDPESWEVDYQGNAPKRGQFLLQMEYKNKQFQINIIDKKTFEKIPCISFEQDLDYKGVWLFTAGSGTNTGVTDPDHVYLERVNLYDTSEKVSAGHNQHYHEAHKKKAVHDMANFDHQWHAKDLIHSDKSFFNKDQFGMENILALLPETQIQLKTGMNHALGNQQENIGYFYDIVKPLHNHKSFNDQIDNLRHLRNNMTALSGNLDKSKQRFSSLQEKLFESANEKIKQNEEDILMPDYEKYKLYDDSIADVASDFKLLHKKIGALESKLNDMSKFEADFNKVFTKMEQLSEKDVEQRRKQFQESDHVTSEKRDQVQVNLQEIDDIFDEIELRDKKSALGVFVTVSNLFLVGVIGTSYWVWYSLQNLHKIGRD